MRSLLIAFITLCSVTSFSQDKKYTFVFLNKNPQAEKLAKEESDKIMQGHMANIEKLASEGKLLAAGPFEGGGGIFILNTTSIEEAKQWISTDPGIQAKRWNIEMFPYRPLIGSVCTLSPPYEMVMYSLFRFDAVMQKDNAGSYGSIMKEHKDYIKSLEAAGNVITHGIFGEDDGGIVVMKGDVQKEVFENDPAVEKGITTLHLKKLYIAKGAFCEK
jgi:uncharacterized protein YciI